MTETEQIEMARAYVALSNAHNLGLLANMFDENSNYRSSAVGEYQGRDRIIEMMQKFFLGFPDVHWEVRQFRYSGNRVEFDFILTATDLSSGERISRSGHETIRFSSTAHIESLRVEITSVASCRQ